MNEKASKNMCSGLENQNRLTNLKISRSKLRENLEN